MIILFTLLDPRDPYAIIGEQHLDGLNAVESSLVSGMNEGELILEITNYVKGIYFPAPDTFLDVEMSAIIPNAYYSYINHDLRSYSEIQSYYIEILLRGLFNRSPTSLLPFFQNWRDEIVKSGMSKQDQIPLLICNSIAVAELSYWIERINDSGCSWYTEGYFNSEPYVNYANLPHWISACLIGTLSSANMAYNYGQIDPPKIIGVDIVSALMASVALSAGTVMFGWTPKIIASADIPLGELPVGNDSGVGRAVRSGPGFIDEEGGSIHFSYSSDRTRGTRTRYYGIKPNWINNP